MLSDQFRHALQEQLVALDLEAFAPEAVPVVSRATVVKQEVMQACLKMRSGCLSSRRRV